MFVEVGVNLGAHGRGSVVEFCGASTILSSFSCICEGALGVLCCCSQGQLWVMLGCVCVQTGL